MAAFTATVRFFFASAAAAHTFSIVPAPQPHVGQIYGWAAFANFTMPTYSRPIAREDWLLQS